MCLDRSPLNQTFTQLPGVQPMGLDDRLDLSPLAQIFT